MGTSFILIAVQPRNSVTYSIDSFARATNFSFNFFIVQFGLDSILRNCQFVVSVFFVGLKPLKNFKTQKEIRQNPAMDAYSRFTRCIYEWERKLLRLIGHDFLDGTFKPNVIAIIVYMLIFIAMAGIINTIIHYDVPSKLFCVLCLILLLQVWLKIDIKVSFTHVFTIAFRSILFQGSW